MEQFSRFFAAKVKEECVYLAQDGVYIVRVMVAYNGGFYVSQRAYSDEELARLALPLNMEYILDMLEKEAIKYAQEEAPKGVIVLDRDS